MCSPLKERRGISDRSLAETPRCTHARMLRAITKWPERFSSEGYTTDSTEFKDYEKAHDRLLEWLDIIGDVDETYEPFQTWFGSDHDIVAAVFKKMRKTLTEKQNVADTWITRTDYGNLCRPDSGVMGYTGMVMHMRSGQFPSITPPPKMFRNFDTIISFCPDAISRGLKLSGGAIDQCDQLPRGKAPQLVTLDYVVVLLLHEVV